MARSRRSLACSAALLGLLAGCAADPGAPEDEDGDPSSGAEAVTAKPCAATDASLFFHGMSGYGRELAQPGLCVPSMANAGTNGFWSDVAFTRAPAGPAPRSSRNGSGTTRRVASSSSTCRRARGGANTRRSPRVRMPHR